MIPSSVLSALKITQRLKIDHQKHRCCLLERRVPSSSLSSLSQEYQRQMQKLDGELEEVDGWIDGAGKKMDGMDGRGHDDAELKVVMFVSMHVKFVSFYFMLSLHNSDPVEMRRRFFRSKSGTVEHQRTLILCLRPTGVSLTVLLKEKI